MQDKEMFDLFKSLDGIAPPAGVRERILNERILKEKDTPVNDIADEASVFSIIEDKRSDIAAPQLAEEEEKESTPPPTGEEKAKEIAILKQPKTFIYLGIAAACIAVILLGAFAISFIGRDKKIDTAADDSSNSMKDKILTGGDSMYKLLDAEVFSPDENGELALEEDSDVHADRVYRLKNGGYLVFTTPFNAENKSCYGAIVLDKKKNIVAEKKDAWLPDMKFLGSTEKYAFFGQSDTTESEGDVLNVSILDLTTLEHLDGDGDFAMTMPTSKGSSIVSFTAVPEDYVSRPHKDGEEQPELHYLSIYAAVNTTADDGSCECAIYRMCYGDRAPEKIYTLSQKKGSSLLRLESVFAGRKIEDGGNIYAVYSSALYDTESGLYKKTYYFTAIDPSGKNETLVTKLFDESDPLDKLTFEKNYQVLVPGEFAEDTVILNRNTGTLIYVYYFENKDEIVDGKYKRELWVNTDTSLVPLPTYEYIDHAHFSATEVNWESDEFPGYEYEDEDGIMIWCDRLEDMPQEYRDLAKPTKRREQYSKIFFSRVEYSKDGRPARSFITAADSDDGLGETHSFISFEGAAIILDNGYSVIEPLPELESKDIKIHTADKVYSGTLHNS